MNSEKKIISIIIPVYNEEDNINIAYNRISEVMQTLDKAYGYELIFTDNHSSDDTFFRLQKLAKNDKRVKVIRFSKNIGYQKSILNGFLSSSGDAAIQLDCDMQDPPEMINDFILFWEQGYKVVFGIRKSRKENFFINFVRRVFYKLVNLLSEDLIPLDAGDFRLIDKDIIFNLGKVNDHKPYLRGIIASFGFEQKGVEYHRDKRGHGISKFRMKDLFSLAFDGVLSHSILPLRLASFLGVIISILTVIGSGAYLIGKLYFDASWPRGFATTTILILFSLSLNALFLGIIGEYLGRIYANLKKAPVIFEETINF